MRYYSHDEFWDGEDGKFNSVTITESEEDIRLKYYPYWYEQMCKKFGKENVDAQYSFEDCLDDYIVVHWAWEVFP